MRPANSEAVVLDSWAVLAYFEKEPAGPQVAEILAGAQEKGLRLIMSVVNAGEVWYIAARRTSEAEADFYISRLKEMGTEFVDADWSLARQAARLKSKYRLSLADCFAAALARREGAQVATGDKEFRQVGREVRVRWLGQMSK